MRPGPQTRRSEDIARPNGAGGANHRVDALLEYLGTATVRGSELSTPEARSRELLERLERSPIQKRAGQHFVTRARAHEVLDFNAPSIILTEFGEKTPQIPFLKSPGFRPSIIAKLTPTPFEKPAKTSAQTAALSRYVLERLRDTALDEGVLESRLFQNLTHSTRAIFYQSTASRAGASAHELTGGHLQWVDPAHLEIARRLISNATKEAILDIVQGVVPQQWTRGIISLFYIAPLRHFKLMEQVVENLRRQGYRVQQTEEGRAPALVVPELANRLQIRKFTAFRE